MTSTLGGIVMAITLAAGPVSPGAQAAAPAAPSLTRGAIEASVQRWSKDQPAPIARMRVQQRPMSRLTRGLLIVGGIGAGFFAGAYAGAAIENAVSPCHCDDPGLKGALIGMPIGAIVGGVATALATR